MANTADTKKFLRKAINRAKGPANGTVITFYSDASDGRKDADGEPLSFLYGAIFVEATGRWYLTSDRGWFGKDNFTNDEFVNTVLVHRDVHTIKLATAWETV